MSVEISSRNKARWMVDFKVTQKTWTICYEDLKLLSKSHGDKKNGKADEWQAYLKNNQL